MRLLSIGLLALLAGCATADQMAELENRVQTLETDLAAVKKAPPINVAGKNAKNGKNAKRPAPAQANPAAEALLKEISTQVRAFEFDKAKEALAKLEKEFPDSIALKKARKFKGELAVIGKDAPQSYDVEKWYVGDGVDFSKPTLLVFWEVWCPHCRREVPALQKKFEELGPKGFQVVGMTRLTKSATEEKVLDFIKENKVTYPMAKENGDLAKYFNVGGIPAAAFVKDGKIIWRGHPARLTDEKLLEWSK